MSAQESLREGRLQDALDELQDQVRADPANSAHRVFLFQLLSVLGEWRRALNQLNVLSELDASALMMAQAYREALASEVFRTEVFKGKRRPLILGEPRDWLAMLVESLALAGQGRLGQAFETQQQALEAAPASSGAINDTAFEWIADADSRLGPVLELILRGNYYWAPFEHIAEIHTEPPEDLRDIVWLPAQVTWISGGQEVALIPARYPETVDADDAELLLGRKTDWTDREDGYWTGAGQRMLATDVDEFPLLEVRSITVGEAPRSSVEAG